MHPDQLSTLCPEIVTFLGALRVGSAIQEPHCACLSQVALFASAGLRGFVSPQK
jgi:hypothetical protein